MSHYKIFIAILLYINYPFISSIFEIVGFLPQFIQMYAGYPKISTVVILMTNSLKYFETEILIQK